MYSYYLLSGVNHYVTNRNMKFIDNDEAVKQRHKLREIRNKYDWLFKVRNHSAKVVKDSVANISG